MVEYQISMDLVFASLADATRRDILRRVASAELTVTEIADAYDMSLAAISKHLKILERAQLIQKRREGKQQYVSLVPASLHAASETIGELSQIWGSGRIA